MGMRRVTVGLVIGLGLGAIAPSTLHAQPTPPPVRDPNVTDRPAPSLGDDPQNILFRTRQYVAQIIWRRGIPYMTVSQNGWRVLADVRSRVLSTRGTNDPWTSYTAVSGDYRAVVRVNPSGIAAIEVWLGNQRIAEEYATAQLPKPRPAPSSPTAEGTVLGFDTPEFTVRILRQQGNLLMNLYDRKTQQVTLRAVPVRMIQTSRATVYQYDGEATVQVREDVRGQRSLLILRDNAIQYRGEGLQVKRD